MTGSIEEVTIDGMNCLQFVDWSPRSWIRWRLRDPMETTRGSSAIDAACMRSPALPKACFGANWTRCLAASADAPKDLYAQEKRAHRPARHASNQRLDSGRKSDSVLLRPPCYTIARSSRASASLVSLANNKAAKGTGEPEEEQRDRATPSCRCPLH